VSGGAGAVAPDAEIVDHDFGAAACQPQRMRPSKTIARAGDDGDASVKLIVMMQFLGSSFVMPGLDPPAGPKPLRRGVGPAIHQMMEHS